jgi:hypothetical protein
MQQQQQSRQQMMSQFQGNPLQGARQFLGAADEQYQVKSIPVDSWNPNELTAHQLRPLRMAIIAGSFPYKAQLEEHKRKLRLPNTDAVLNEEIADIGDSKKTAKSFRFLGVDVERLEVDADGKPVGEWLRLDLAANYQMWLDQTYIPFQPEDPKLAQVRFRGLAMPLLREFHASKASTPGIPGMASLMGPAGTQTSKMGAEEGSIEEDNTKKAMDSVLSKLPKLQATLSKLNDVKPQQIARPKFRSATLPNAFDPEVVLDNNAAPPPDANKQAGANAAEEYIPEYALVRVVDTMEIKPGKHYRYRLRVKMANPNYKRKDVASPAYKVDESLESDGWVELKQTLTVPQESFYYAVDEKQGLQRREMMQIPKESAQYRMLNTGPTPPDQVAFQLHRWMETTQRSRKDPDQVPVGEWVLADRVLVARGEYIGRKVNVDLPIWIYSRNAFILPSEERTTRAARARGNTGIDVDFGEENPENNLILVDFEGGRINIPSSKADDICPIEVLMLSPDGKLLARTSLKDANDSERQKRREQVLKRIQEVREGKKE